MPVSKQALSSRLGQYLSLENLVRLDCEIEIMIAFNENTSRVRKDFAPQKPALMRHFALNLLKTEKNTKASIHIKRLKAGWDDVYLLKLLSV
ncbi:MAG: hypothetical protein ACYDBJ_25275 [Aggregatilineales bacterium]